MNNIMEDINELISLERPISAVTYTSTITHSNSANNVDSLRFGSKSPIHIPDGIKSAEYKIGSTRWYEIYFEVGSNTISSESEN